MLSIQAFFIMITNINQLVISIFKISVIPLTSILVANCNIMNKITLALSHPIVNYRTQDAPRS